MVLPLLSDRLNRPFRFGEKRGSPRCTATVRPSC